MSKFVTTIKTNYTNVPVSKEKKTFVSAYSSKNGRRIITGENRSSGKKFASQLIK
jgi:hypothetical protein